MCGQASDSDTDVLVLTTNGLLQARLVVTADAPLDVLVQGPGGQTSGTAAPGRPFTLNRNAETNGETRTVLSTLDGAKPRWTMGWR